MKKLSTTLSFLILWLFTLYYGKVMAQNIAPKASQTNANFDLKSGDRVVFLGNSLFENDLPYNYLEFALTTRWANQNITFRNIAWTGDNVWGEARSYISSPSAYDLLIEQLTKTQPTVVFIAYGAIEAQEGEEGVARFNQGLNKLLDKIAQLGAKAILLSPIPAMDNQATTNGAQRNAMLELYAATIAKTAAERGQQYINIYKPMLELSKKVNLSDNGIHLNETGYYYLATTLEKELGLTPRQELVSINIDKNATEQTNPVKILDAGRQKNTVKFTLEEEYLPLPLPALVEGTADKAQVIKIAGLKKGVYTLTADDTPVITASAAQWKEGVAIRRGASFSQAAQVRDLIFKKNQLFFQQYRPQNRTYILGFRAHEQGRHARGLEDLNIIISYLEGQIALNRHPKAIVYQLTPLK
ncbi:GDSL-type esterase/lipase family protein [Adhaeribacter rhizoryzae]|uniref:GDSL family lipase n=1 Tax=Adhaeribacter rhizoryzae TaxID=2607907 RepID=A0A5M6DMY1_9BACT|nr:GDSL-type esterase/lipase family protein [Adhaeribacter rhizoryzae]KAA5547510.1 GDSL family lipase [Adhaeribacter rhizoryzae]